MYSLMEYRLSVADIEADNGVVHVIDAVLIPERISVVDVIVNSEDHQILETAVVAAGLAEALDGEGPFTVFAPTDAAFAALPEGAIAALLADAEGALADILKYHVLGAKVMSGDLEDGMTATTLLGKDIYVTLSGGKVFINGVEVTVADIETDNGVVHVIDAVLDPSRASVVDIIVGSADHEILETAVLAAGLETALSGAGPFTVFAPTDAAFAALDEGVIDALLADAEGALTDILLYHVLGAKVMSADLENGMTATTLLGEDIEVTISDDGVFINDAQVIVTDLQAGNGVVHVIDVVLVPGPATNVTSRLMGDSFMKMYPNPATTQVTIDLDATEYFSKALVTIYGMDGRVVSESSVRDSRTEIPLNNFNKGFYIVVMRLNDRVQTEKLIVR
jgi:uncharacterized surface protein with fasciclin (FAS1) repeats